MTTGFLKPALTLACLLIFSACSLPRAHCFRYRTPEKNDSPLVKAQTLLAHEDIELALQEFRKLTKSEPKNHEGYQGIADCLYFQSDYLKAMDALTSSPFLKEGDSG